jgi:hypothetical protein
MSSGETKKPPVVAGGFAAKLPEKSFPNRSTSGFAGGKSQS